VVKAIQEQGKEQTLMTLSALRTLRLLGPLAAAAALALGALPALAQSTMTTSGECAGMRFELANPDPGSMVDPGHYVVQGIAADNRATQGTGVDHVDFFLDSREAGGIKIGSAVPAMTSGPFGPDSFQTTVNLPDTTGGHDFVAYAHSAANGAESVISVPIAVGEDVSKAFATPPSGGPTEMCMGGSAGGVTSTTTAPATTTTQPSTTTTTAPTSGASSVTFQVANPSPGDTIHVGGLVIQGIAADTAAQQGTGIDRIDIFLDNREEGGTLIGHGSFTGNGNRWTATVDLAKNQTGVHSLFFYAHSTVSGHETVVEVPVDVEP
jgi:hypothetical protein